MISTTIFSIFKCSSHVVNITCLRNMSRVKKRFTMPPFWQPKKTRVLYPEHIEKSNEDFLQDHITDKYQSPLKFEAFEKAEWAPNSYRCGLITKKIGVYPMWMKNGQKTLCTLLHVCDNHVIKYIEPEKLESEDYKYKWRVQKKDRKLGALVVGAESADPRLFTKEYFKIFESVGVMPKRRLAKFFVTPNAKLPPGMPLNASHFRPGDTVDCAGITVDRGFQGVMKRWGFKGGRATHGVTKSHRRPGNIGGGGGAKARVWPGTKMPGHMGRNRRTLRGALVLRVNTKHNVIWIKGPAVPGESGNYVILYDSILRKRTEDDPVKPRFPTSFEEENEKLPEDLHHDQLHTFSQPSIQFSDEQK